MRGNRMHQHIDNTSKYLDHFHKRSRAACDGRESLVGKGLWRRNHAVKYTAGLLIVVFATCSMQGQDRSKVPIKEMNSATVARMPVQQQTSSAPQKRMVTLSDAVSIFLQQNLQLVA